MAVGKGAFRRSQRLVRTLRHSGVIWSTSIAGLLPSSVFAGPPALTAEKWLNTLTVRPFDDRRVVVLFIGVKLTRDLEGQVTELNKIARRSDVVVVGVTSEGEAFGRRFIEKFDPRFAVGVQSRAARAFDVRQFPSVLVFRREETTRFTDPAEVSTSLGAAPSGDELPLERLSTSELRDHVRATDDTTVLEESLSILRLRMPPDEFMSLCDELEYLKGQNSLGWKGTVRYQRHLADPDALIKQSDVSPGREAFWKAKKEGTFPTQEVHDLFRSKPEWTTDELMGPFLDNLGTSDAELVYRWDWAGMIGNLGTPKYADALAEMLEAEPDANLRMRIAAAISDIYDNHPFQDPALVERLERQLQREDDIRWVRPMLELAIHQLKNHPAE